MDINTLLTAVRDGTVSVEQAAAGIAAVCSGGSFCGAEENSGPSVINCAEKRPGDFAELFAETARTGRDILGIHAEAEHYRAVAQNFRKARYNRIAGTISFRQSPPEEKGLVFIATSSNGGMSAAQEAAETCRMFGSAAECSYGVGIGNAGSLRSRTGVDGASCIIAVTGAEGVLPALLAELTGKPVIALPTDYNVGSWIRGTAALFASVEILTPGIAAVGANNGFGAGYFAALINNQTVRSREEALQSFFRAPPQ